MGRQTVVTTFISKCTHTVTNSNNLLQVKNLRTLETYIKDMYCTEASLDYVLESTKSEKSKTVRVVNTMLYLNMVIGISLN